MDISRGDLLADPGFPPLDESDGDAHLLAV
jgi:hypothetical protein